MGKKTKKTRWRTLTLNGHQSDSEESSTPSSVSNQTHRTYYSSKFNYSSQSTPTRKYQNDSSKTTRSNSTTSEHKTTFNEDEYTRITTPRQDVLFKKGYLNKPKNYQTQNSTGTSSTANSTSTCTPDHQSADGTEGTDLEYESSQFVFPNGFVDQNGIYYINSYEPFPFVVYNAPICYQECPEERTKRYSTDSGADSVSTHNEEQPIQNGVGKTNEYYCNNAATGSDNSTEEPRRLKKKRRRKVSRSKEGGDDISCDSDSSEELPRVSDSPQQVSESDPQTLLLQGLTTKPLEDAKQQPLKPDAEEFVPRTFQTEIPYETNSIQYINFAPGYIPVPYVNGPTFLPPGIPVNYVPVQEPKFVNIIVPSETKAPDVDTEEATTPVKKPIDMTSIVSKLEEAAAESQPVKKGRIYHQNNGFRAKPLERQNTKTVRNYSTTVKKSNVANLPKQTCNRHERSPDAPKPQRLANQWISVSSKKRKKKVAGDHHHQHQDDFEEKPTEPDDDNFESYDVDLLEDVVVAPANESRVEEIRDVQADLQVVVESKYVEQQHEQNVETVVDQTKVKAKEKKKKTAKRAVKKIMITDDYQPNDEEQTKSEEPQVTKSVERPEEQLPPLMENTGSSNPTLPMPEPQEKKKKKKKKVVKIQSMSSSTTTLSNFEDSYDFLLENSIMEDSDQKTNVEMSEALDIVIQKGMFNSLEEKIKALNIGASDDGFFKTINFGTFKAPVTPSKHFFTPQQFDKLFQKEVSNSETEVKSAIFLENPTVKEIIETNVEQPDTKQYPITQAVKNWLTKTRENTPDVEALKNQSGDEVTLWSVSPQTSQEGGDLLEFWENEPLPSLPPQQQEELVEEAIEIYESKYGKNEDYLQLKAEIEEQQQKVTRNFPRHGNLPYRAICCNIM